MAREKELRRSLAVFPIGTVMKLTDLTARQIRYYEDQGLIQPERTAGNRRMYSLNDMDRLLEIKDFLDDGCILISYFANVLVTSFILPVLFSRKTDNCLIVISHTFLF